MSGAVGVWSGQFCAALWLALRGAQKWRDVRADREWRSVARLARCAPASGAPGCAGVPSFEVTAGAHELAVGRHGLRRMLSQIPPSTIRPIHWIGALKCWTNRHTVREASLVLWC